ncbi:MAG TPA: zinc ABC transporter substrate-binding protein [Dongiaceae bacterium]|jgi:zinc/manganese transport system substrate-binding protein|nr:zinc ABC transporter substrate-binding protein [Dongiaceae bacterium]
MKRWFLALSLGLTLATTNALAAEHPKIVASFSVLGDIVRQVAGDKAEVTTLVGPDGDAHTFEPTPADASKLAQADLVVVNGLGLESWMDRLLASAEYKGPIAVASEGITTRTMVEEQANNATPETVTDPHAWQDLKNGQIYVRNVAAALAKADPANAAVYAANAKRYQAELAALDQEVRAEIGAVPESKRRVITSHDAFGYFGAAYGVEFLAPEGLSTEAEPSAGDLARLITQMKAEHIRALFVENITDPRLVETISRETGAPMGGALFSDALSPADGPAPTYTAMFKNNVPKLVAGMQQN